MNAPYGLISDLHCHNWSAFASVDEEGRNTRLMDICREIDRCCEETLKAGGRHVYIAGDLFHVRGSVDASVFNPVKNTMGRWDTAINFIGIAGNHDLKTKDSIELGSSVAMLKSKNVTFYHNTAITADDVVLVPWHHNAADYLAEIERSIQDVKDIGEDHANFDLICHIGIDGTLSDLKPHGVTAEKLASFGFRRVFSGHYHHFKDFGNGVYSVGATTHQTWSDVNTKAGFLIVYPDRVQRFASHAPEFIDLTGDEAPEDVPLLVDGHFVRAKIESGKPAELLAWRDELLAMGAKGVIIPKKSVKVNASRSGTTAKSLTALDKSVTDYCSEKGYNDNVSKLALEILNEARSVAA